MTDHYTDFVADDPWLRPQPARIEQARELLRSELASSGKIRTRDDHIVSVFFSPKGGLQARCPRCGAELVEAELAALFDEDYDTEVSFRLQRRAAPCCGSSVALNELLYVHQFAFARFGIQVLEPVWKFQGTLTSERAVDEMARTLEWVRIAGEEWCARHAKWGADLMA